MDTRYPAEPWRVKVVEFIKLNDRTTREKILKEAHYNIFNVKAEDIYIDLLTDSGTSAMSDNQWAGLMLGDESYAGCKNYFNLKEAVQDICGFKYAVPTHQGRSAEHVLFRCALGEGQYVVGNGLFDTTVAHVLDKGGIPVDFLGEDGYDAASLHPFKGNMDVEKLKLFIDEKGAANIAFIIIVATCNNNGGQPVSMENIKAVSEVAQTNHIPLFYDAARFAENAYFIKEREPGYENKSTMQIAQEMFSYADGCTMSSKKTAMVNIGGFIGLNDDTLYGKLLEALILYEGFPTYGGLAGRDLEALARGLYEGINEDVLAERIRQVRYFGERLIDAGIPVVKPIGGHAVYTDAFKFLPHIAPENLPGETLIAQLYLEGSIRGTCLGRLAFGGKVDPVTGEAVYPSMEMIRFAVPRRVYTDRHIDAVVEALKSVNAGKDRLKGFKLTYEPPVLKHFLARFEPL